MTTETNAPMSGARIFVWIALATGLILLIPLTAMLFTDEVSWDMKDFAAMGILLFSTGSLFVLVSRMLPHSYRVPIGIIFMAVFLIIWAELSVGVFTNFGS